MKYFLGIDAGTNGVKAIVIGENGYLAGMGYEEYNMITPKYHYAEENPGEWWAACKKAVRRAVHSSDAGRKIEAIGITGQMLATTCLDRNLDTIGNCIIWLDQRATREKAWIEENIGSDTFLGITANHPLPGFWAPKLMWMQKHTPEEYEKIYKVLFSKDYLRFKMTGDISTEVTDASGSFLFDVPRRKWSDKLFSMCGIDKSIVPDRVLESCDVAGYLQRDIARELGLKSGIPVVAGCGDQQAGGVGNGVIETGMVSSTIGASGVVFAAMDTPIADKLPRAALSMCHVQQEKWCLFGCTLGAGGSFKWLRDSMFPTEKKELASLGKDVYNYMSELAQNAKPGSEGLCFLPYLNGERTPYSDPNASGVFFGITYRHGREELCRSVMEGVTFSLRDTLEILREYDIEVNEIRASGGGAKSSLWRHIQADIFNASILSTSIEEAPACGVALMASVGCGAFASLKDACRSIIKITGEVSPDPTNVEIYEEYYETYRSLYPILKDTYARQAELVVKNSERFDY